MKRRLFNLLAGVSLLMCVATLAVWTRSCLREDVICWVVSPSHGFLFSTLPGRVCIGYRTDLTEPSSYHTSAPNWRESKAQPFSRIYHVASRDISQCYILGFVYQRLRYEDTRPETMELLFSLPCYLPAIMTAALPLLWLKRRLSARPEPGRCPTCGYDLRATPERCPECGSTPAMVNSGR